MRKVGFSIVAAVLTWLLLVVCVVVIFIATELRYYMGGSHGNYLADNYGQLGIFLVGVSVALFVIASLNTYFLLNNIRLRLTVSRLNDQESLEKRKRQPENQVHEVLASLNEDEIAELRDLIVTEDAEKRAAERN
jgi:hypothetical protein